MATTSRKLYRALIVRSKEIALLETTAELLVWDQRVNLPSDAAKHRSKQIAYLSGLIHEKTTAPEVGEWISLIETSDLINNPESDIGVNVRELRRTYDRAVRIPRRLVEELSKAQSVGLSLWSEARQKSDFGILEPALARLVRLSRERAEALGYPEEPYDALIDDYEPGLTTRETESILGGLRKELVPLLQSILTSTRKPDASIFQREYPVDRQEMLCRSVADAVGFKFSAGRIDTTAHPFTAFLGPMDIRITTRYAPRQFREAFFATLHEAGHGMYQQGLDPRHFGTPLGTAVSTAMHESQSRIWENAVGHSRAFWVHFFPVVQQKFPEALGGEKYEDFYFAINEVKKQFVRVGSDEVTYNLHIILRFDIEQKLFSEQIKASEVPDAWREGFKAMFDMIPPDDREGCLQDVHWGRGAFGYFPAYSLGNIYAAQLYAQATQEMPGLESEFERGRFDSLRSWLHEKVHKLGQTYRAKQLTKRITGEPPNHKALITQLKERYETLYTA